MRILVDIKSGSPDKWHPIQLAAYIYAYQGDHQMLDGGIVYLRKTGRYGFKEITTIEMAALVQDWKDMVAHYYEREFSLWA
jgi:hypothetical protein